MLTFKQVAFGSAAAAMVAYASFSWGSSRTMAQVAEPAADASAGPTAPADCLIEPSQTVKLSSPVEGVIAAVGVDRGDMVRRGEVVARLQSEVESAGVAVARARAGNTHTIESNESRLKFLARKQERAERLKGFVTRNALEEAQTEASVAASTTKEAQLSREISQLELDQARQQLAQRVVRSPISGVVTERAMSPGEFRSNEQWHIVTIARLNPLNVEVFAPLSQLDKIRIGSTATIFPEDPIGGRYQARVTIIDRVFDAASGTFGVRLSLPNPGNKLPAGMRCRVDFHA